jgi:CubicO group peptidase (beta-lactamase class C family)
VQSAMSQTGVPGVAVAVVYQDKVVYSKGFGVREVGKLLRHQPPPIRTSPPFAASWASRSASAGDASTKWKLVPLANSIEGRGGES